MTRQQGIPKKIKQLEQDLAMSTCGSTCINLLGGGCACLCIETMCMTIRFTALNEQLKETLNECLNDKAQVRMFLQFQVYSLLVSKHKCVWHFETVDLGATLWNGSWDGTFLGPVQFVGWRRRALILYCLRLGGWTRRWGDPEASRTGGSATKRHFGGWKGPWRAWQHLHPSVTAATHHESCGLCFETANFRSEKENGWNPVRCQR